MGGGVHILGPFFLETTSYPTSVTSGEHFWGRADWFLDTASHFPFCVSGCRERDFLKKWIMLRIPPIPNGPMPKLLS